MTDTSSRFIPTALSSPKTPARSSVLAPQRKRWWLVATVIVGYLALGVALARTRPPHTDEGHFANAAALMGEQGRIAMPMATEWIASLDQRLYAVMPAYFVALAGWFKVFGVSFIAMRLFSVLCGAALVVGWSVVIGRVTGRREGALLGAILVGLDYDMVNLTTARYDAMCAALNVAALVAYLSLRERHLTAGVAISASLLAASCMVHPYGAFGIMMVGVFALGLDGRRLLDWRVLVGGAVPFIVALTAWGVYVMQDLLLFREQLSENASGRVDAFNAPLGSLFLEMRERYLGLYGGVRPGVPLAMRAKLGILALYLVGIAGCILTPRLRKNAQVRALLVATVMGFLMLAYVESYRWYVYLIHVLPLYAACTAVFGTALLERGAGMRRLVWAGAALVALFAVASVSYRVRQNVHGRAFEPTLAYLQHHVAPRELVMAGGEFGLGLHFADHVLEDPVLGYHNGRRPDWIVQSRDIVRAQQEVEISDPPIAAHVRRVLASYEEVFTAQRGDHVYRVLRRP